MRNGQDIKPGDIVECAESELHGVLDKFDILEADPPPNKTPKVELLIQLRPNTSSWFDVINPATGKAINTKALKKAEAEELAGHSYTEPAGPAQLLIMEIAAAPGSFNVFNTLTNRPVLPAAVPKDRAERFVATYDKLVAEGQGYEEAIDNVFKAGDPGSDDRGTDEI